MPWISPHDELPAIGERVMVLGTQDGLRDAVPFEFEDELVRTELAPIPGNIRTPVFKEAVRVQGWRRLTDPSDETLTVAEAVAIEQAYFRASLIRRYMDRSGCDVFAAQKIMPVEFVRLFEAVEEAYAACRKHSDLLDPATGRPWEATGV